jgi:hypothetical protein
MLPALEAVFPGLVGKEYRVTSPEDDVYNCIAWAAGVTSGWWWPDKAGQGHWPTGIPREPTVDAFRLMFATLGFEPCPDADPERGFEKIALFATEAGVPKHAARQLATGRWTSKLGIFEDIEHDLRDLEGTVYGSVALIMRRKRIE